jgi:hypothetical protein
LLPPAPSGLEFIIVIVAGLLLVQISLLALTFLQDRTWGGADHDDDLAHW